MAHREWGQCGKHVEGTEALRCIRARFKDFVHKIKDREECGLSAAADKLAEEGRRCSYGGGIILIFIY
jgi:hypothetical protein